MGKFDKEPNEERSQALFGAVRAVYRSNRPCASADFLAQLHRQLDQPAQEYGWRTIIQGPWKWAWIGAAAVIVIGLAASLVFQGPEAYSTQGALVDAIEGDADVLVQIDKTTDIVVVWVDSEQTQEEKDAS